MTHSSPAAGESWHGGDGGKPCACGRHCAERDYQGIPAYGPRAFCDTDRGWIGHAIRSLPLAYAELRGMLAPVLQRREHVSGSRDAPAPVNLDVHAFMAEIIHVTLSWEDQVRAAAGLSDPDGPVRDGAALVRACRLLAGTGQRDTSGWADTGYLDTLLSLPAEAKERFFPATVKLGDLQPGTWIRVDPAGDAWGETSMDGTGAGMEFLRLNGRARGMLGYSRQRRRITEVPCDGCRGKTLVQREAQGGGWEPAVRCTACPAAYTGAQYDLLMGRVYQAQLEALRKAS